MTVELTTEAYDEFISSSDLPILVDFWADWCGPCRRMSPILDELSNELSDKVMIAKVDTMANPDIASKLDGISIRSIPAFVLYDADGTMVAHLVGARSKEALVADIATALEWEDGDF